MLTGLETVYISKLVSTLERDGLVRRSPHPDDTRAVQVTLTTAGVTAIEAAIDAVQVLHEALLAPIGGPRSPQAKTLARTFSCCSTNRRRERTTLITALRRISIRTVQSPTATTDLKESQ